MKEAEGKISLMSTFTVGICNDQEMPEAPVDCMFKGDYLFMSQWSLLPFELFDGLSVPKCDSRGILSYVIIFPKELISMTNDCCVFALCPSCIFMCISHLHTDSMRWVLICPHFIGKETEIHRD